MASSSGVSWPASSAAASGRRANCLRTSRSTPRSAGCARGTASRSSAGPRVRRIADPPVPQTDSTPPNRGSYRTARRCGWACAAGVPHRAPGSAAGPRPAARPAGWPTSPWCAGTGAGRRGAPAGRGGQRIVEDPLGLHHPRAGRRLAGSGVPQRPCRHVDQRVGGQRLHVDVVGIRLGQRRHRVGVGGAAGLQGVGVIRVVSGEAGLQRLDQSLFDRRRATRGRQAQFHPRAGQRSRRSTGSNASHALL